MKQDVTVPVQTQHQPHSYS